MKWLIALLILVTMATALTMDEAQDAYLNATLEIEQLKGLGFSTQSLEDHLALMKEKLEGVPADHTFVIEKAMWIHDRKELMLESSDMLAELHQRIATTNQYVNLSTVQEAFTSAEKSFKEERYEDVTIFTQRAYDLLEDTEAAAARERGFLRLARRNLFSYAKDHWFSTAIMLIILGMWTFIEARVIRAQQKIKQIKLEMTSIAQSENKTQEDYDGGNIGSGTYRNRMALYQNNYLKLKTDFEVWIKLKQQYKNVSLLSRMKLL